MEQEITVLYQDSHLVAIDKPAGILVHGDGKADSPTLTDWLVVHYPEAKKVGEPPLETPQGLVERPGVVHRLDRDTSGVLLLAITSEGYQHLKRQFGERTIRKQYVALVYGLMREDRYLVTRPIGRAKQFGRWTAIPHALRGSSREAETTFTVQARYEVGEGYTLVEAWPQTGRTHQLRVHLQYLNHPIVADSLYAGKRNRVEHNLGFTRQALHAEAVSFLSREGQEVVVRSPVPEEFTHNPYLS